MIKKLSFILLILLSSPVFAGTVSFDQVAVSNDITVAKYNADLNTIYQDHNSNIQSSNIADGSLLVGDFASSASPQVRTDEGAACDFVYTGLISTTTSGTLTGSISAGTAYPVGYRINKASPTAHTFTSSKWTFVDLDFNGNFQYSEVAINGATPAVAANSLRLERVSTDGTQIQDVQDLRKISCTNGPLSQISDAANEATLSDIFSVGADNRRFSPAGRTPEGWVRGLYVSQDSTTTRFIVTKGSAYINGKYRYISQDVTVPITNDDPANGISGLDTGSVVSDEVLYAYAVADQPSVRTLSITTSTSATAPSGVTNYRLIGKVATNSQTLFASADKFVTAHGISEREIPNGWVTFSGAGGIFIADNYNVSALTDNGTGDYTISWDADFNNALYAFIGVCRETGSAMCNVSIKESTAPTAGTVRFITTAGNNSALDSTTISAMAIGDSRR